MQNSFLLIVDSPNPPQGSSFTDTPVLFLAWAYCVEVSRDVVEALIFHPEVIGLARDEKTDD